MALREIAPWRWGELRRWDREETPFAGFGRQMEALQRDMDRIFDYMAGEGMRGMPLPQMFAREQVMPFIDEVEDDKAFHVSIELPGMDKKDVDITLTGRQLTIRGEKKREEKRESEDFYLRERSFGSFRRTLDLPGDVDETKIEAAFKDGVLKIELPKTKEAQEKVKHIPVKAA